MRGFRLRAPTMSDPREKGAFQADIPSDAVEEALRSVERAARSAEAGEATPEVEGAPPGPDAVELAAEAESLRAQLELSTEKGRETLERLKDEHERHLRAAADLENYKKRAQREREEVQRFGAERLVKDLIPVLDNLDRALAAARDDDPLGKGVKLVRSGFEQVFGRHGVKPFSALGKPFDPAFHEALLQIPSADAPPGTVVLEHGRGFLMHDRLVRPALVGVSIAPAPPPGPEPEPAPEPAGDAPATGGGAPGNGGDGEAG